MGIWGLDSFTGCYFGIVGFFSFGCFTSSVLGSDDEIRVFLDFSSTTYRANPSESMSGLMALATYFLVIRGLNAFGMFMKFLYSSLSLIKASSIIFCYFYLDTEALSSFFEWTCLWVSSSLTFCSSTSFFTGFFFYTGGLILNGSSSQISFYSTFSSSILTCGAGVTFEGILVTNWG